MSSELDLTYPVFAILVLLSVSYIPPWSDHEESNVWDEMDLLRRKGNHKYHMNLRLQETSSDSKHNYGRNKLFELFSPYSCYSINQFNDTPANMVF